MRKIDRETVEDTALIAGLIRQLLFVPGQIQASIDLQAIDLELEDLIESNTRSKVVDRKIKLSSVHGLKLIKSGTVVKLEFAFGKFKATGDVMVDEVTPHHLVASLPKILQISNARNFARQHLDSEQTAIQVLVQTDNLHAEGTLIISDVSANGIGGTLSVPGNMPIQKGTTILGRSVSDKGDLQIQATIVRISPAASKDKGLSAFNIGLIQYDATVLKSSEAKKHSRKSSRVKTQEHVTLVPLLRGHQKVELNTDSASVTGFSGTLRDSTDYINLPVGSQYILSDSTLVVQLVAINETRYRFQLVAGSEADRIKWLKRITPYIHSGASISSRDARDILDIFCESGALSAKFLKSHKNNSQQMLHELESDFTSRFWVHRWISKQFSGKPSGHISAIKMADNLWLLGDLVGSQDPLNKLPRDFVPFFFKSFKELSLSLEPCPRHMIMWVEGHPYWRPLEQHVENNGSRSKIGTSTIAYTRVERSSVPISSEVIVKRVQPDNIWEILEITKKLKINKLDEFARSLDFDADRFGSPGLRDSFQRANQRFYRHYYTCNSTTSEWLLVLTGLPLGISLNRIPESAWLFPLEDKPISDSEWTHLKQSICNEALSIGIKLPSIRRFLTKNSSTKLEGELATLKCLLAHPSVWNLYKDTT